MRNFYLVVAFTIASLALATLFFLYPAVIRPIPYGTFTFTFATLICFWVASRLRRTEVDTTDEMTSSLVQTLQTYFWVMGTFFFFDGIAHVGIPALYPDPVIASYAHTFSHIFFFVGNAFIIRIPISFINRRWMNAASMSQIAIGIVAVGWRLIHPDSLVTIAPQLPPIIITDKVSGLLFLAANTLALLLPGLFVLYRGFLRMENKDAKIRAICLALGMMIFFSIGPVIDLIQNQYTQLLIHLLQASSFGLLAASALYKTDRKEMSYMPPQAASQTA